MGIDVKRYDGIQCLRAIAAFLVLYGHIKLAAPLLHIKAFSTSFGGIGVDLFFVISGFVISLTVDKGLDSLQFLKNRFSRVVPFYYLMSAYFLYHAFRDHRVDYRQLWNSFMFLPIFDKGTYTPPLHLFGWSLAFEIWFYLVFAAILNRFGRKVLWILPAVFIAGVVANLLWLQNLELLFPRFVFHPMTLEFSAGVLIFRFKERIGRRSFILSSCLVIVLSPIIFLTDYSFNSGGLGDVYTIINSPWLGMIRLSIWGTTAVLLVVTVVGAEHIFKIAWPKILTKFGDASYSLYLIQPYGFVLIGKMEVHKPLENWEKVLIWIGFSTALCIPLRQMVETPITEFVKNALNRKTKRGVIYV